MDALTFPRNCVVEGAVTALNNDGDIIIENGITPHKVVSDQGDVQYLCPSVELTCGRFAAPDGLLKVEAKALIADHLEGLNVDIQCDKVAAALKAFENAEIQGQTLTLTKVRAGSLTIRAQEVHLKHVEVAGTLTIIAERIIAEHIKAKSMAVEGRLECKRVECETALEVRGGSVALQHLDAPEFTAAPDVGGLVAIATCTKVRAEGVRGFLHPSELSFIAEAGNTQDLGPAPVMEEEEPEPVAVSHMETDEEPEVVTDEDAYTTRAVTSLETKPMDEPYEPEQDEEDLSAVSEVEEAQTEEDVEDVEEEADPVEMTVDEEESGYDDVAYEDVVDEVEDQEPEYMESPADDDSEEEDTNPNAMVESIDTSDMEDLEAYEIGEIESGELEPLDDDEMSDIEAEDIEAPKAHGFEDLEPTALGQDDQGHPWEGDVEPVQADASDTTLDNIDAIEAGWEEGAEPTESADDYEDLGADNLEVLVAEDETDEESELKSDLLGILEQMRLQFTADATPKFIDQLARYIEEGRYEILLKEPNQNAVLANFDRFQNEELSRLGRGFFAVLGRELAKHQ